MNRLQRLIHRNRIVSLLVSLIIFVISGALMRQSGECLKTTPSPAGIVSFEMAFTQENARAICSTWKSTTCKDVTDAAAMAVQNTYQDFLFILGYGSFLLVLVVIFPATENEKFSTLAVIAVLAALVCDVIENVFMLIYLNGKELSPLSFGIFASIKFLLIIITIINVLMGMVMKLRKQWF